MTNPAMTIWRVARPLILASQSRSRKMLLANAGLAFETIPADIDERAIQQGAKISAPGGVAGLLAGEKARFVSERNGGHYVVGADQTLALGDRLFNKPDSRAAAAEQIRDLAGATHELHSAIAVALDSKIVFETIAVARMSMRPLGEGDIDFYLDAAGDAVTTSVGAYQLEGLGVNLFERIEGDYFTILGLPLLPLLGFFRREKLIGW
jgi:septum formation protein